jgi:hypothetical protein
MRSSRRTALVSGGRYRRTENTSGFRRPGIEGRPSPDRWLGGQTRSTDCTGSFRSRCIGYILAWVASCQSCEIERVVKDSTRGRLMRGRVLPFYFARCGPHASGVGVVILARCYNQRRGMPTISTFYGILIRMFFNDHAPPHFRPGIGSSKPRLRSVLWKSSRASYRAGL